MIAFEASESRGLSADACSKPGVITVPWLEAATGADALVSPLKIPLTQATLPLHLGEHAVLVQIKHGEDLLMSAGYRANDSLARMLAITSAPWQRLLLPVGYFAPGGEDVCLIGTQRPSSDRNRPFITWTKSRGSWSTYLSILRRWSLRGGTVGSGCIDSDLLHGWLHGLETDLSLLDPVKEFYQPVELDEAAGPLQDLHPVKDWRRLLSAFPGIGPAKIDALVETFASKKLRLTGAIALEWVLDTPILNSLHVPGWGTKTHNRLRQWLGLADNEVFFIDRLTPENIATMRAAVAEAKELDGYVEPAEDDD